MKKKFLIFILFIFNINAYTYEPTHSYLYFEDYVNQIENLLNKNLEVIGNNSAYVVMEYSGDDLDDLDINNENIINLYLVENQKNVSLPNDRKQNYKIIKKLIDRKGDYLHIPVIYFKICGNKIYITIEEYKALVHYKVKLNLIKDGNKIKITNMPEWFDNYNHFKTGLTVYSKWYR